MISYWIKSTKNNNKPETLEQDLSCDVCVIGAGIFGLSVAYYLAKKGLKVIVLDKGNIGEGVSSFTTAKITSQHGLIYNYLANDFGTEFAKLYLESNQGAIQNIKNIIDIENIECDFEYQNSYVYTTNLDETQKIEQEADIVNSLGFKANIKSTLPLPFKVASSIEFPNQAQFHPRKYMLGLYNSIIDNKSLIFSHTTAVDVRKDGLFYDTFTTTHKITSKHVVLASHYPFINIPGFYFTKMYQSTSYALVVETKQKLFEGMYINIKEPIFSFRTIKEGDKRLLLIAGRGHKTGDEQNVETSYLDLEAEAKKLFPDCNVLYRWNTEDCITLDKVPYIGKFSNLMPNVYIGTGFNKWGMTTSNVAANIITDNILGIDNKYQDVFISTRMSPIKNRWEVKNIIKQTTSSLILENIKIPDGTLDKIQKDNGAIIEVNGKKVGIYKDSSGNIFAVKPICTHLGCLLTWNNLDKTWDCPCHGSRFDFTGKNLYDPAIKNLGIYNL